MFYKFMEVQRFHCKICETNFAKGHVMKGHIISVHVDTKTFFLNYLKLVLQYPVR